MPDQDAIEVVAKLSEDIDGNPWPVLEYYMENNPRQTEWRKVPGFVTGTDKDEAMVNAQAIARELSNLNIQDLQPAVRKLYDAGKMVRKADLVAGQAR